ncbi:energy transducer TonB [Sphingomonas azotifigens]|uniref:energy transducer TonB n=1 Tax=Sphingomonas azotifigens TaxID=330920 RepID=UPI0009FFAE09|nr:energy transducer TonB [Sphingomonas azotifigens]
MHADSRYHASAPRSVSFGAALAINGAIIAGMLFMAPNVLVLRDDPIVMHPVDVKDVPPPPPEDQPKPKLEKVVTPTQPLPTIPDPVISHPSDNRIESTTVIADPPLPYVKPVDAGPPVVADPPRAVPALIGASTDPRFAQDFQPEYPSQEIRAQRDGLVTIRVLIGTDGRVKAVEPVSATSDAFFAVTKRQALGKWRFRAATRGGVPEESWKTMTVRFRIEDAR